MQFVREPRSLKTSPAVGAPCKAKALALAVSLELAVEAVGCTEAHAAVGRKRVPRALTAPETTVLIGGKRVLGTNHGALI